MTGTLDLQTSIYSRNSYSFGLRHQNGFQMLRPHGQMDRGVLATLRVAFLDIEHCRTEVI
jgi:hypothetical protein